MMHRLAAEFIGTFWLGARRLRQRRVRREVHRPTAPRSESDSSVSSLAFGLTVLTGVYAFGTISGGHFNPAVTLGAALARRVEWKALPAYWITQVIGGLVGGHGDLRRSPRARRVGPRPATWPPTATATTPPAATRCVAVIVAEVVLTGVFLLVILGVNR